MKHKQAWLKEIADLNKQLYDRMAEIAVIDCIVDGEPFYMLEGGKDCNGWSVQADKVRELYKKAHPIKYVMMKILNALGGGE